MGNFKEAYKKTMIHEGGYSDDPDDAGGETYKGISRVYNPTWSGWRIIDSLKNNTLFPAQLGVNKELQEKVLSFYKAKYWDVWLGDIIPYQELCEEMFDTGVNMGTHRCQEFLQEALNFLNRNGKLYRDLVVDGAVGPVTLKALTTYLSKDDLDVLLLVMNLLQGAHYLAYMRKSPKQEKYARGWFKRVQMAKEY